VKGLNRLVTHGTLPGTSRRPELPDGRASRAMLLWLICSVYSIFMPSIAALPNDFSLTGKQCVAAGNWQPTIVMLSRS
jgi:hypothetical protein